MSRIAEPYDYLFVGLGASASLLLMSLDKRGLLDGRRIAVLEPAGKQDNDKTYCFWSRPEESASADLGPLVSYAWGQVQVDGGAPQPLAPMAYRHIASLDLYRAARQVLARHEIVQIAAAALHVLPGNPAVVETADGNYRARWVFDSRPPRFLPARANEVCLDQSFLGYRIRLAEGRFDTDVFEMMYFGVPQDGGTQFVYSLPYARDEALVELTRFGRERLDPARAAVLLDAYICEQLGPYERLETERGCIPMCSAIPDADTGPGLVPLGTRAGLLKPSTGYGVKAMHAHAEQIAEALRQQPDTCPPTALQPRRQARFALYDRLLLLILAHWPGLGKPIFQRLFRSSGAAQGCASSTRPAAPARRCRCLRGCPGGLFCGRWVSSWVYGSGPCGAPCCCWHGWRPWLRSRLSRRVLHRHWAMAASCWAW
ncbi:MAG: lycopene cyclase family protein [Bacteroidia bacterium]